MSTFIKLAWRNVLRNKRRSLITLSAVAFSLTLLIFFQAMVDGGNNQMLNGTIKAGVGHIQIHKVGFLKEPSLELVIDDPTHVQSTLNETAGLQTYAQRIIVGGLVSTAQKATGAMILGIEPEKEAELTIIKEAMVEGEYLTNGDDHKAIIGRRMSEYLDATIGDKIVAMIQAADGSIGAEAYRVKGIFESNAPQLDKGTIFITLKDAQLLTVLDHKVSEFVLLLDTGDLMESVQQILKEKLSVAGLEIVTWRDVSPFVVYAVKLREQFSLIIAVVVFLIAAFGILNTFMMVLFERIREFGVMMALGIKPNKVLMIVLLEALLLASVGVAVGTILGLAITYYFVQTGIQISGIEEISKEININFGDALYPMFVTENIIILIVLVFVITILTVIYPAIKAARLRPVEALRFV